MQGVLPQLLLVGVLILINAVLAGTEVALITLREGQLHRMEQEKGSGPRVARLARDPTKALATIQIGITLAGFLASAAAAVSLAEPLVEPLSFLGRAARPVAILLITLVLAFITLVLGELAPKRLAMQRSERWARAAAPGLELLARVTRPAVWALEKTTDLVVRLLGGDPRRRGEDVTEEEVRDLIVAHRQFTPIQKTVIVGALEVGERLLRDVVRPRGSVVSIAAAASCDDGVARLTGSGHSRAPVVGEGGLDDTIGVVHLRHLLGEGPPTVGGRAQPPLLLPESIRVLDALRRFQAEHEQIALVINEHGGVEGIVTMEDLVEELVGEIYDETDRDVLQVRREPDGSMVVPGAFPVHDLPDIGIDAPEGEYTTVAGLVLDRLGRIPEAHGDAVEIPGWTVEVLGVSGRRITLVRFRRT